MNEEKYYKVVKQDLTATHANFAFAPYVKSGDWLPEIPKEQIKLCKCGYHITKYWNMWYKNNYRIFEVECKEIVGEKDHCGVEEKVATTSFKFNKEVTDEFYPLIPNGYRNTGDYNTGDCNTGNCNTGNCNTGDRNTGDRNTGYYNTGDYNTGNRNTGNCNTGDYNTGNRNTGNCNTGDYNTGNRNIGDCNIGDYNIGNYNTGDYNTGDYNTGNRNIGDCNTGNFNTGYFNTNEPKVRIFNKETDVKREDIVFPNWIRINSPTAELFAKAFNEAEIKDVELTLKLPNFDFTIFEEITGIGKSDFEKKLERKL